MADADATPLTDAVAQSHNLDAVEVARLEVSERLAAIGSAEVPYGIGGGARLVGGLTLLVAGLYIRRAMRASHPVAITIVAVLLAASGIASSVSGASAVSLTVLAPEPQTVYVPASGESGYGKAGANWGYGTAISSGDAAGRGRSRGHPVRRPLGSRDSGLHAGWPRAGHAGASPMADGWSAAKAQQSSVQCWG